MATTGKTDTPGEMAILGRLFQRSRKKMSPQLARYLLTLGFSDEEQARMEELAAANEAGKLTATETSELFSYVKAGHILALLQALARRALKTRKIS